MEEDVPRPIRSASAARPLAGSCRCVCPVVGSQHQKCRTFTACTAFTPIEDDDEDDYEKGRARSNALLAARLASGSHKPARATPGVFIPPFRRVSPHLQPDFACLALSHAGCNADRNTVPGA